MEKLDHQILYLLASGVCLKGREAIRSFPDEAEKDVNIFTPVGPHTVQQREVPLSFRITRIPMRVFKQNINGPKLWSVNW